MLHGPRVDPCEQEYGKCLHGAQHTGDPLPVLAPAGLPWARGRQAPACSMEEDGDRVWGAAGAHACVAARTHDPFQTGSAQEQ